MYLTLSFKACLFRMLLKSGEKFLKITYLFHISGRFERYNDFLVNHHFRKEDYHLECITLM